MHIRPFPAIHARVEAIRHIDEFCSAVKESYLQQWQQQLYVGTETPAFFIHQIHNANRTYTGITACVDMADYLAGKIRKHEHTLAAKEQKQLQLLLENQAQVKPVLLTYPHVPDINRWVATQTDQAGPFLRTNFKNGEDHLFWRITDPQKIQQLQRLFRQNVPASYIADGHHRASIMAILYEQGRLNAIPDTHRTLLCDFFPSNELDIMDFNRVVEVTDLSAPDFQQQLADFFTIKKLPSAAKPSGKHQLTMCLKNEWFALSWRSKVLREFDHLNVLIDADLLNKKVMEDILGIDDVRTDERVQYVPGPKGLQGIQDAIEPHPDRVGFCLYPIKFEDLVALTDENGVLPPKSTWFEPRIKNGLLVKGL